MKTILPGGPDHAPISFVAWNPSLAYQSIIIVVVGGGSGDNKTSMVVNVKFPEYPVKLNHPCTAVQWSPDGEELAMGFNNVVIVWRIALFNLKQPMFESFDNRLPYTEQAWIEFRPFVTLDLDEPMLTSLCWMPRGHDFVINKLATASHRIYVWCITNNPLNENILSNSKWDQLNQLENLQYDHHQLKHFDQQRLPGKYYVQNQLNRGRPSQANWWNWRPSEWIRKKQLQGQFQEQRSRIQSLQKNLLRNTTATALYFRITSIDWSSDGQYLASAANTAGNAPTLDEISIWNVTTQTLVQSLDLDGAATVQWSPNSQWLGCTSYHQIVVWDMRTGYTVCEHTEEHASHWPLTLRWCPNSRRFVTASHPMEPPGTQGIFIWFQTHPASSWKQERVLTCPSVVTALSWNPQGTLLVSSHENGAVGIWDASGDPSDEVPAPRSQSRRRRRRRRGINTEKNTPNPI